MKFIIIFLEILNRKANENEIEMKYILNLPQKFVEFFLVPQPAISPSFVEIHLAVLHNLGLKKNGYNKTIKQTNKST